MKKRYLYALLFGIPGFFVAGILSMIVFGVLAGTLWIFVWDDNPWPAWTEKLLPALFGLVFLLAWIALIVVGYQTGKRLESDSKLSPGYIVVAGSLTQMFVLLILLQQFSVGNMGPKSDSALCSDYYSRNGYAASGLPRVIPVIGHAVVTTIPGMQF